MKKLQCPLCGGDITIEKRVLYSDRPLLFHAGCEQCRWETNRGYAAEKDAWKAAEKYISGFPPIMRVWPGDEVKLFGDRRVRKGIGKNANRGILYLETASGPPEPVRHDDVILWPWEIEQNGGRQD